MYVIFVLCIYPTVMWSQLFVLQFLFDWSASSNLNILLIVVDDLRPALGCYRDKNAYTPNIDKLAEKSILFHRAYAQQSLCAPSRNSFLTSRRPDSLLLYDFYSYWRNTKNFTTLPQYLKNNGYTTKSIGKIFHPGISSNNSDDSPYSWSEVPFHPRTNIYKNSPVCFTNDELPSPARNLVCPVNVSSTPEKTLPDIETLHAAKSFLQHQLYAKRPFFLAVGFEKPHIPLKYPSFYRKYHRLSKFKIANYYWPNNTNSVAYNPWTDLRKRQDVGILHLKFPWEKIPLHFAKKIIQSYYSAVSYIDDLIGSLIKELKLLKLDKNTIIVLTADHGWSLGEHAQWAKFSNFEVAVRIPLIVSIPSEHINDKSSKGPDKLKIIRTNSIVELVDLFPSIVDLVGLSIPLCPKNSSSGFIEDLCSEGISFVPVIHAALKNQCLTWKRAAFSQYPRPGLLPTWKPNSDEPRLKDIKIMGYTIRTDRFRYTAWITFEPILKKPNWNKLIAEELYDHKFDQNELMNQENNTIYSLKKVNLNKLLKKGWRAALPKSYA